jgi:hypothetical protein
MSRKPIASSRLAGRASPAADTSDDVLAPPTLPDWVRVTPEWVPPSVAIAARALCKDRFGHRNYIEVLKRLVTDVRMKRVWAELRKKTRPTRTIYHLPKKTGDLDDATAQHERALGSLLYFAVKSRLIVKRDTGDAQARCFAILFAEQCRQLFGSPLYGITATVASVALGRTFSLEKIREWVASDPHEEKP